MGKLTVNRMLLHYKHFIQQIRNTSGCNKPYHLICFKQWTPEMVMEIINSAIKLKCIFPDMHCQQIKLLKNCKVMVLQEVNEPVLHMAVSKAATFLGATDVSITDHLIWDEDYLGGIFSTMADIVFVCTSTHMCVQRFADKSVVPVLCMRSRTHASIQSLATVMAVIEIFGTMEHVNVAWVGAPHPVLNSYLLLCPMLGANFRFKCCCDKTPVSPLLYKASTDMTKTTHTVCDECKSKTEVLKNANVIISGPTAKKKDKVSEFELSDVDICNNTLCNWMYFHTCPRGEEVSDDLFYSRQSLTFVAFGNMKYIAAALMARAVKCYTF